MEIQQNTEPSAALKKTVRILQTAAANETFGFILPGCSERKFRIDWPKMDEASKEVKEEFKLKCGRTCRSSAFQQLLMRAGIKRVSNDDGSGYAVHIVPEELFASVAYEDYGADAVDQIGPVVVDAAAAGGGDGAADGDVNGGDLNGGDTGNHGQPNHDWLYWYGVVHGHWMQDQVSIAQLQTENAQLRNQNHQLRDQIAETHGTLTNMVSDLTRQMHGMGISGGIENNTSSSGSAGSTDGNGSAESMMD